MTERYEQEQNIADLMTVFCIVSVIIGCLGLYGLIAVVSASRTKEIGIRKVLGASIFSIIKRFAIEVILLVIIAFAIAAPAAYLVLERWLQDYKYSINIGFGFFATAFSLTLLIALLTISHRTITTALSNPATTLKDE